jgi:chemotaxis family two-component system sensor histidine kinase/response regulator PixL
MTINPDIRDHAYLFFAEEVPELLHTIESELLTLRQGRTHTTIHSLMRAAHSIKGGAASVGLTDIASLAHRLENIFKALYDDTLKIDPALETELLKAFDCLRSPLIEQITTGSFGRAALPLAETVFSQIEARLGDALLKSESYMPSAADLGVNMITSIFEVDVAAGLERLALVLENPQEHELAGELRAQIEVFAGFAELLNLPAFGAIADTVQQALQINPDQVLDIAYLALIEFEEYREAILTNRSTESLGPSPALLEFTQPLASAPESTVIPSVVIPSVVTPSVVSESVLEPELELDTPDGQVLSLVLTEPHLGELVPPAAQIQPSPSLRVDSKPSFQWVDPPKPSTFSVRVDADRLERMNNLVGELSINRDSISLQNSQLQESLRGLLNRFGRFQGLVNRLQEITNQMLVMPSTPIKGNAVKERAIVGTASPSWEVSGVGVEAGARVEFDPLEMDRYNSLHTQMQEILEDLALLEEGLGDVSLFAQQSNHSLDQQRHRLNRLRDELVWARMLPLSEILNRFPRTLRDLSATYGKPVRLSLSGETILIERAVLEKLYDPLLHLLRNAFDHGIEPVYDRQQQNKPEEGLIEIRAYYKGSQTIIEVRDDGQGLNLGRIRARALELGWLDLEQVSTAAPEQLLNLIFEPGFSTATQVTELSGRGVGLDVVQSQLQSIKGTVTVASTPGQGTTFTLSLPLTLTITKLVTCLVGPVTLALPTDSIEEIVTPQANQIRQAAGQRLIFWREQILPIYRMADLLEYHCPLPERSAKTTMVDFPKDWAPPVLILRQGRQFVGLEVDQLMTEQEMVVKPFGGAIAPPDYIYACTILAEGSLVPVIDGTALLARFNQPKPAAITYHASPQSAPAPLSALPGKGLTSVKPVQVPTILVVDDSTTLRRTMALFLERAGYRVLQARDGQEAIDQLHETATIRLVVCDIEMPNMNGFEFLNFRRQDARLLKIPVVILTSRSNDKHRWLAMQLGATAYFTKPYLEQEFLSALQTLIDD